MQTFPQKMQSLRAALCNAINALDIQFDPRPEAEKDVVPPAIGAEWLGGIYVGNTLENNERVALVLLPEEFEGNWKNASAWAAKQNGTLPSRVDLLVLWLNARDQFQPEWYWSSEEVAGYPEYAWSQGFYDGIQYDTRKGSELRARAVRRVSIR